MKRHIHRSLLTLVLVAIILEIASLAAEEIQSPSIVQMNIIINGQAITPTKSDGTPTDVFAYDGTTYVPLRYFSELIGVDIEWDASTPHIAKLTSHKFRIPMVDKNGHYVNDECNVPILMYHHFADNNTADTVVSGERFREQMTALRDAGYHAITAHQLIDYVDNAMPLPPKPVLITMDDGYTSNLETAAPILEDLEMCATVFVIGINEGEQYYVHSGSPLTPPRFAYEDAADWVEKGVLDLQSHTLDMHQLERYGYSGRNGMLPLPEESEEDYRQAILEDVCQFQRRREGRVDTALCALAYPFGYCKEELDALLDEAGIAITLTTQGHSNLIKIGDRSTLRMLGRYIVTERMTGAQLVSLLEKN